MLQDKKTTPPASGLTSPSASRFERGCAYLISLFSTPPKIKNIKQNTLLRVPEETHCAILSFFSYSELNNKISRINRSFATLANEVGGEKYMALQKGHRILNEGEAEIKSEHIYTAEYYCKTLAREEGLYVLGKEYITIKQAVKLDLLTLTHLTTLNGITAWEETLFTTEQIIKFDASASVLRELLTLPGLKALREKYITFQQACEVGGIVLSIILTEDGLLVFKHKLIDIDAIQQVIRTNGCALPIYKQFSDLIKIAREQESALGSTHPVSCLN